MFLPFARKSLPPAAIPFGDLTTEGFAFVDPTRRLAALESVWENHRTVCLRRPPHFGKSLLATTLLAAFDEAMASRFEPTFANTACGNRPPSLAGKFRVVLLNFAGLSSADHLASAFQMSLVSQLTYFFDTYPHPKQDDVLRGDFARPALLLRRFFDLARDDARPLLLLIDDLDEVASSLLEADPNRFAPLASQRSFLTEMLEEIEAADDIVRRVLLAGLYPIAFSEESSPLHGARDLTTDSAFSDLTGFTEADLRSLADQALDLHHLRLTPDDLVAHLKDRHGECRFSPTGRPVFNPGVSLHYLSALQDTSHEPVHPQKRAAFTSQALCDFLKRGDPAAVLDLMDRLQDEEAIPLPSSGLPCLKLDHRQKLDSAGLLSALFARGCLTFSEKGNGELVAACPTVRQQFALCREKLRFSV